MADEVIFVWEKFMKYKEIAVLVAGIVAILWTAYGVKSLAEENAKKISDQETFQASQVQTNKLLTSLVASNKSAQETMMTMLGIDPEKAKRWSHMPQEPVTDTSGIPITGVPWVIWEDEMQLCLRFQYVENGEGKIVEMLVDTLYDVREK